jgi:hypothetical protein
MFKKLLRNRKGTAEVIGSVMFIVILLFFFTNVYLWHDAATKEMNDMYVEKVSSPIAVSISTSPFNPHQLTVTNNGGIDATLSGLWVDVSHSAGAVDGFHGYYNFTKYYSEQALRVPAGGSLTINWHDANTLNSAGASFSYQSGDYVKLQVSTTVGNLAICRYHY